MANIVSYIESSVEYIPYSQLFDNFIYVDSQNGLPADQAQVGYPNKPFRYLQDAVAAMQDISATNPVGNTIVLQSGTVDHSDYGNINFTKTGCVLGLNGATVTAVKDGLPVGGTIAVTNGSGTVIGTGTSFLTQVQVSSQLNIAGVYYTVSAVTDNTTISLEANYAGSTASGLTVTCKTYYYFNHTAGIKMQNVIFNNHGGSYFGNISSIVELNMQDCRWQNGYSGIWQLDAVFLPITCGFQQLRIKGCTFDTLLGAAIRLSGTVWQDGVYMQDIEIFDVHRRGIQLGSNDDQSVQTYRPDMFFSNILMNGVISNNSSAFGLIVYGTYYHISNCTIRNVVRLDGGTDCSGIYTKATYGVIDSVIVVDSGSGEASINIKGRTFNDVQKLTFSGMTNGVTTFTLAVPLGSMPYPYTSNITYDASTYGAFSTMATTMQTQLAALANVGSGNVLVAVSSYSTLEISIEFIGTLAGSSVGDVLYTSTAGTITFNNDNKSKGYQNILSNFQVLQTPAALFPCQGVAIKCEKIFITNGFISGTRNAIYNASGEFDRYGEINGVQIYDIYEVTGSASAISISSNSEGYRIRNVRINGVRSGSGANCYGIRPRKTGDYLDIEGNRIENIAGSSGACVFINEDNNAPITALRIANNEFINTAWGVRLAGPVAKLNLVNNDFISIATDKWVQWTVLPTVTSLNGQVGLVTNCVGEASIAASQTSVTVTPSPFGAPKSKSVWSKNWIDLTAHQDTTATGQPYISAVNDTTGAFTISVPIAPVGSPLLVGWRADITNVNF